MKKDRVFLRLLIIFALICLFVYFPYKKGWINTNLFYIENISFFYHFKKKKTCVMLPLHYFYLELPLGANGLAVLGLRVGGLRPPLAPLPPDFAGGFALPFVI